ncbi:MAG: hypothetical protein F7C81_02755, partial [Desulfurococcales archaeon]|nr:hypothetical protein [Desulfurococcales archaeon]
MLRIITLILISMVIIANISLAREGSSVYGVAIYRENPYLIKVKVSIRDGNGTINVYGAGGDTLFRESLKEACYLAAWIHGINPWSLDYDVFIDLGHLNTSMLYGPSLSLAVYLASISSILTIKIPNNFIVTGMINPDGSIGFVSDVDKKGELADRLGIPYYLYPAMQENLYDIVEEDVHVGAFTFSTKSVLVKRGILSNISANKTPIPDAIIAEHFVLNNKYENKTVNYINSIYILRSEDSLNILNLIYNKTINYLLYIKNSYTHLAESVMISRV